MRILFITSDIPYPPFCGARIKSFNLIKHLAKAGDDVFLFSFFNSYSEVPPLRRFLKYCRLVGLEKARRWRRFYFCASELFGRYPYFVYPYISNDAFKVIEETIQNHKINVVHFDSINVIHIIDRLKRYQGIRTIASLTDAHPLAVSEVFSSGFAGLGPKALAGYLAKSANNYLAEQLPKFSLVTFCARRDKEYIEKIHPGLNIEVLPNGVDVDYFHPSDRGEDCPSLVYVACFNTESSRRYVYWFLKNVFTKMQKKIHNLRFYVIGKGGPERLKKVTRHYKGVVLTGYVEDTRQLIWRSSVAVSLVQKSFGILNKVLEYMSMGKAVVGLVPGFTGIENSASGQHFMAVDSAEDFLRSLTLLLEDKKLRDRIGAKAREFIVNNYSWEKIIPRVRKLYS